MRAYYNEHDAFAAQWLRNLIAAGHLMAGDVDERDIQDVHPDDLRGYTRCHFFAGIGGWDYALSLAGWPDDRPVWTGSCPCQRFSSAARGRQTAADIWPHWRELIASGRPRNVFGEQVASARAWMDGVCDDLDALGFAVWPVVLPAYGVGADHARERFYFAGHADGHGQSGRPIDAEASRLSWARDDHGRVVSTDGVSASVARVFAGFGNAIVPQVAAEFVSAYLEAAGRCLGDR